MWDAQTLAIVGATFVLAGVVKGVVGFGMPTIAVAILTASIGLAPAIALMTLPTIVTNIWQAVVGGAFVRIVRRFWPMLVSACIGIWFGVSILASVDPSWLAALLGLVLCVYAVLGTMKVSLPPPGDRERWLSPVLGIVNGLLSGMTGTFVVPSMLYFQALTLPRDMLVQTMGVLFTVSMAAIAASMAQAELISTDISLMSAFAVLPALAGMALGRSLRQRMSELVFRRAMYVALFLLGLFLITSPLHG